MRLTKKSQVYLIDYIISILIFGLLLTIYYRFEPNLIDKVESDKNNLLLEAKTISVSLVSEGVPKDWWNKSYGSITRIGLMDEENMIYKSKLEKFYNLSYQEQRTKLNVKNDFYIFLRDKDGGLIDVDISTGTVNATGYYDENKASKTSRIVRVVNYENELHELVVYSWY